MKVKSLILILFLFLSVLPIGILGTTGLYFNNQKKQQILINDLKNTACIQAEAIKNYLEERRLDASFIIENQEIKELLEIPDNKAMQKQVTEELNIMTKNNSFVNQIVIMDMEANQIVNCSNGTSNIKEEVLEKIEDSANLQFLPVIVEKNGVIERSIQGIQGIYEDEKPIGVMIMDMGMDFIERLRGSSELIQNGTIYLVDAEDNLIAAGDNYSSRKQFQLTEKEKQGYIDAWNARDKTKRDGILCYKALGQNYMSYYMKMEGVNWRIISSINMDQILQTKKTYVGLIAVLVLILISILAAVHYVITWTIRRPIETMTAKFRTIKEKQDYSIRMNNSSNSEIGVISREIDMLLCEVELLVQKEKEKQEQLKLKADKDALTGLFRKETIEELLSFELERLGSENSQLVCFYIDIDDFKHYNTQFGHIGGDQVLKFIADSIKNIIQNGIAGRIGGDEFMVYINGTPDMEKIEADIQKLIQRLNEGVVLEMSQEKVPVRCSVGVVRAEKGTLTAKEMIECADRAMYEVKNHSKNGYVIIDSCT